MTLYFTNLGEIDPRLISTMGVNVKETDSPIGYFGTGLKYAIAVTLRLGGQISIWSGETPYNFTLRSEEIRGKSFDLIYMNGQALGFTSELGKAWEPWMAYRELYCNAKDEGGEVSLRGQEPKAGLTMVEVNSRELSEAHSKRATFILHSQPILAHPDCDIHISNRTRDFFYRGIRVGQFSRQPLFTYDFRNGIKLSEDRTASISYDATLHWARAWHECTDREMLRTLLTSDKDSCEHHMDLDWSQLTPSEEFLEVLSSEMAHGRSRVMPSARAIFKRLRPEMEKPQACTLTGVEEKTLERAKEFLAKIGLPVEYPIVTTESLGPNVLGLAKDNVIYLAKRALQTGTKCVAGTLMEENLHLKEGVFDLTRSMQNWLIDKLMSFGEELLGEPL